MNNMGSLLGVGKGAWTEEEDLKLRKCIEKYGEGDWNKLPLRAGLNRCHESCRLRWMNYLHPNIKRGQFEEDEIDLIIRLHKLLGNRWSLIAGRIPGRTAIDIMNYWNFHLRKKLEEAEEPKLKKVQVLRPRPHTLVKRSFPFSSMEAWGSQQQLSPPLPSLEPPPTRATTWAGPSQSWP